MATLKELSERTGYSAATISRVLNADWTRLAKQIILEPEVVEGARLNLCSELVWQKCLHLKSS